MTEGRALIQATLPFIREQPARSWFHFLLATFLFAGFLAIGATSYFPWYVRLASGVPAGLVLCRLFIIYHDQQHGTIMRGSRLAKWMMTTLGVLMLNPPSTWNASHNHHHKHNGKIRSASIGSFPIMTVASYKKANWKERFAYRMSRHPLTIAAAWITVFLLAMTMGSLIRKPREHIDCLVAVIIHVIIWALLIMYAPGALLYSFIVPLTISSALGAYLFYVQHNFPAADLGEQSEWDYVFAAMKSSSFLDTNRLMHWFTGNIGYHHIHHLNARIPFYRLPEVMKAIPELQTPGRTSLSPAAIISCFRLKLWDPEKRALVGFKAAATQVSEQVVHA